MDHGSTGCELKGVKVALHWARGPLMCLKGRGLEANTERLLTLPVTGDHSNCHHRHRKASGGSSRNTSKRGSLPFSGPPKGQQAPQAPPSSLCSEVRPRSHPRVSEALAVFSRRMWHPLRFSPPKDVYQIDFSIDG